MYQIVQLPTVTALKGWYSVIGSWVTGSLGHRVNGSWRGAESSDLSGDSGVAGHRKNIGSVQFTGVDSSDRPLLVTKWGFEPKPSSCDQVGILTESNLSVLQRQH